MRLSQKQIIFLISAAIAITTLVAYEPIRHNGFVNYDDTGYILDSTQVKSGITWESLGQAFTKPHYYMWHPLTTISNMLDYEFFGLNPTGHHLVSVAIHIVNALLLFWILTNITGTIWGSAFVAAVFALHPLQVESVAWAAERKTVLSGLFWLLTMAAYIRYARKPGFGRYLVVLLVFGLCIMTKPVVVMLPFALLLLDYWPLDRFLWGHQAGVTKNGKMNQKSAVWLIIEKIPLLAMSVFLSVMTFVSQKQGGGVPALDMIPLDCRVANMFLSYIRYIGTLIWPSGLAVYYPYSFVTLYDFWTVTCAILFIMLTVVIVYCVGRRKKYAVVGWLWYVGTLVPMIGLVQSGGQAMANRYMYISMLGLLIIITFAANDFIAGRLRLKIVAAILAAVLFSALVILTRIQVGHWQNSITLYDYALKVTQNNALVENNYGSLLFETDRLDEAVSHLNKALSIVPNMPSAQDNLGRVYLKQGKLNEAAICFKRVLDEGKVTSEVYNNLASALGMQKKYDEAMKYLNKAMKLDPNNPDIHNKMGMALLATGRAGEAITHFKYVLQTNKIPADKMPAEVYANLGSAYIQVGKYDLAIENLNKVIELKPDNIDALNKLAWLFAAIDDTSIHNAQKAVEFAQRGCELTGYNDPMLLDTLAVSYAAAGRFDEAKTTSEKALNIAKSSGNEYLAGKIQKRIKLYEAGQPYREQ
jgi:protein O-mannosyl-transferase